jgi:RecA-family ATPase
METKKMADQLAASETRIKEEASTRAAERQKSTAAMMERFNQELIAVRMIQQAFRRFLQVLHAKRELQRRKEERERERALALQRALEEAAAAARGGGGSPYARGKIPSLQGTETPGRAAAA